MPSSGSKTMEAVDPAFFEPLTDLPVEESFAGGETGSQAGGGHPSAAAAARSAAASKGTMESDEDLLAHGALLEMGAQQPAPGTGEARPDSAIVPTLMGSAELLDPEVLLGASEVGGPARVDGTNGPVTSVRAQASLGDAAAGSGVAAGGAAGTGVPGGALSSASPALAAGAGGASSAARASAAGPGSPAAGPGSAAVDITKAASSSAVRSGAKAPVKAVPGTPGAAKGGSGATNVAAPSARAPGNTVAAVSSAKDASSVGAGAAPNRPGATNSSSAAASTGISRPVGVSMSGASPSRVSAAAGAAARSTATADSATTGSRKVSRPVGVAASTPAPAAAKPPVSEPVASAAVPTVPNGFAGVPSANPFQEQLPDLPLELMDDPLAVAAPPPGMSVPSTVPAAAVAIPAPSATPGLDPTVSTGSMIPPLLSSSVVPGATPAASLSQPTATVAAAAPAAPMPIPATPTALVMPTTTSSSTAAATSQSAAASPPASNAAGAIPTPAMDRDFIARNQIVERYLSGRLPLKGATDFERFCKDNPQLLDDLGLPERVNAGLRLLEASGKPEPWQEKPQRAWTKPQFVLGLAAVVVLLGIGLAVVVNDSATKSLKLAKLQKQAAERPLDPATTTRTIRLVPSHEAASNTPAVIIGGGAAELVDLKIDETRSAYKTFRITIDRIDQGRVAVLHNLVKDSNGHLRIALNSSALGTGNYQLTIEGLSWRGDPEPDSWVTIGIQR